MQLNTTLTSSKCTLPWNTRTICLPHQIIYDDRVAFVDISSGGAENT